MMKDGVEPLFYSSSQSYTHIAHFAERTEFCDFCFAGLIQLFCFSNLYLYLSTLTEATLIKNIFIYFIEGDCTHLYVGLFFAGVMFCSVMLPLK